MNKTLYPTHTGGEPKYAYGIGESIGKSYEISYIIGGKEGHGGKRTGMGTIYLCYDHDRHEFRALKTYQNRSGDRLYNESLFQKEAKVWIDIGNHTNIVRALGFEIFNNVPFIILEYISPDFKGNNVLTQYLTPDLPFERVLYWSLQFCDAMEHALRNGVTCHRDIKPDNMMITPQGVLKLTDFGLSKCMDDSESESINYSEACDDSLAVFTSRTGKRIAGTPPWMSPEQFSGYSDIRSDIYSFGVMLFQMISKGRLPFAANTFYEYERMHNTEAPPLIKGDFGEIVLRCLEKNPDNRYKHFQSLRSDLISLTDSPNFNNKLFSPSQSIADPIKSNEVGAAYLNLNQAKHAIKYLQAIADSSPDDPATLTNLGIALQIGGKLDKAVETYQKSIKLDPSSAIAHMNLGNAFADLGKYKDAISEYKLAIELDSSYWKALLGLGTVLRETNDLDGSIVELKSAINISKDDAGLPLFVLGQTYRDKKMQDEALSAYSKAADLLPRLLQIRIEYGKYLLKCGMPQEAIKQLEEGLKFGHEHADAYVLLASIYSIVKKYAVSRGLFSKALDLAPLNKGAIRGFILSCVACGDLGGASEFLSKEIDKHPADADLKELREFLVDKLGDRASVEPVQTSKSRKHKEYFLSLVAAGKLTEAINEIRSYLEANENDVVALNILADALRRSEDYFNAIIEYKRSLKIDPSNVNAHNNIGLIYYQVGQFENAIEHYKRSIIAEKRNPEAYFNAGNAYSAIGQNRTAINYFKKFIFYANSEYSEYVELAQKNIDRLELS